MPPLEEAEPTEIITYRPFIGTDQFGGLSQGTAVNIRARWVDKLILITQPDSSVIQIVAEVAVDRDIPVNSLLWRGLSTDYQDGTGTSDVELCIVRMSRRVPDIKGRANRYSVMLSRYMQNDSNT
jgi:hypothetical protein